MWKFAVAIAALAAVGFAFPVVTSVKAEDAVVIKKDRDHDRDMDRHHHKKIVVIKHHRRHHRDHDHDND